MCHFITAVLPESVPLAALDAIARKHGRVFQALDNPSVQGRLRPGMRYCFTTPGHCDCGTVLGSGRRRSSRAPDWAAEEQRLRKKGWTDARIARALADKRDSVARSDEKDAQNAGTSCATWRQLIADVLATALEMGLLLHSDRGPLSEDIELHGARTLRASAVTDESLEAMREDVLYFFRR